MLRGLFRQQQDSTNLIQWRDDTVTDQNMNEPDPDYRFGTRARERATETAGNIWKSLGEQEAPTVLGATIGPSGEQIQKGLIGGAQALGSVSEAIDEEVFYGAGKEFSEFKTNVDNALYQFLDKQGVKVDRDWLGFTTGAAVAGAEAGLTGKILKPPKMPKNLSQRFTRTLPLSIQDDTLKPAFAGGGTQVFPKETPSLDGIFRQPLQTRAESIEFLGGQSEEAKRVYTKLGMPQDVGGRLQKKASTHHRAGIQDIGKPAIEHPDGKWMIDEIRKIYPVGDDLENYTTMLDWNTRGTRKQKVLEASTMYPNVPRKTIDDALGASDFVLPDLDPELLKDAASYNKLRKEIAIYGDPNQLGMPEVYPGYENIGKGRFPSIDLINPDGTKTKWKPDTLDEWQKRWQVINKHYGSNIDPKKISAIKVDPNLDMYSGAHKHIHNEIRNFPGKQRLDELRKSGEWPNLPKEEAKEILEAVVKEQHQAAINMAKWQYSQIEEYYKMFPLYRDKKLVAKNLNELSIEDQVNYFKDNVNKIGSRGRNLPDQKYLLRDGETNEVLREMFGLQDTRKYKWSEDIQKHINRSQELNHLDARWRDSNTQFTWNNKLEEGYIDIIKDVAGDDDYFALKKQFFTKIKTLPKGTKWILHADTPQKYQIYKRMFRDDPNIVRQFDTKLLDMEGIDRFELTIP